MNKNFLFKEIHLHESNEHVTNIAGFFILYFDDHSSSKNENEYKPSFGGFIDVDLANKKLSLRSLIDHSVVESFGEGGKTVITSRVYPELAVGGNAHLRVFNNGTETITVERLNAWSMRTPTMN